MKRVMMFVGMGLVIGLVARAGFTPDAGPAAAKQAGAGETNPYTQSIPGTEASCDLVPIPGGSVKMSSPTGEAKREDDEGPQFDVEVEPFYMGKHEVTWAEYEP